MFKSRTLIALALFLIGQAFVSAHAIAYGTEPHEHNGVICLAALKDEQEGLPPSDQLVSLSVVLHESEPASLPKPALFSKNLKFKPPATGPPPSI